MKKIAVWVAVLGILALSLVLYVNFNNRYSNIEKSKSDIKNEYQESKTVESDNNPKHKPLGDKSYLIFSLKDFSKERSVIVKNIDSDLKNIKKAYGDDSEVNIYIASVDVDHDKQNEYIVFIMHYYFCEGNENANGLLRLFGYKNGNFEFISNLGYGKIFFNENGEQKDIRIINNTKTWDDLVINGNTWRWDGEGYQNLDEISY